MKGTLYIYQLRSSNFDGDAEWSNKAEGQLRVAPPPPITGGGGGGGGGGSANRPPEITGPKSLQYPEHSTEPVATYEAEDPEGTEIRWEIQDSDNEHFRITEDGVLHFITPPDYENPVDFRLNNTYEIRLLAFDSGIPSQSGRLQVRIEIKRVNELDPGQWRGTALGSRKPGRRPHTVRGRRPRGRRRSLVPLRPGRGPVPDRRSRNSVSEHRSGLRGPWKRCRYQ